MKRLTSLKAIAFHEKHIALWLGHIRETLSQVDVLLPRNDKSAGEGDDADYGENPGSFELFVMPKIEFDRLSPR